MGGPFVKLAEEVERVGTTPLEDIATAIGGHAAEILNRIEETRRAADQIATRRWPSSTIRGRVDRGHAAIAIEQTPKECPTELRACKRRKANGVGLLARRD